MADKLFVAPAQSGLRIPNPDAQGRDLPTAGARVNATTYWRRLIKDGAVVELATTTEATTTAAAATTDDESVTATTTSED